MIGKEEIELVVNVLKSGQLAQGSFTEEFEKAFSNYIGVRYGIATNSGTSALHVALASVGIKPGDEVLTTPFSFISTATSILHQNGLPLFADIEEETYNIDPEKIKDKITNRTKALIVVHLFGHPCDMKQIKEIVEDYNLILIEDCAQAHGSEYKNKKVGSFGDVACFSFYATKNMTTGEGGMILTTDDAIAKKAKAIRDHGQKERYLHYLLGYNYRMTDISAAIGLAQLKNLDTVNDKRISNANFLLKELEDLSEIRLPVVKESVKHVFHQFTIMSDRRDYLANYLNNKGISTGIFYPRVIYQNPVFKKIGYNSDFPFSFGEISYNDGDCPVAESVCKKVLSLPVGPFLKKGDLEIITESIKEAMR